MNGNRNVSRSNPVSRQVDERDLDANPEPHPKSSPWWPIVLTLAEIAEIVERRRAQEHVAEESA